MAQYTFTVFTPTYNRSHTLQGVYESLRDQTFRDFEWLIVDDGSTDRTESLVQLWARDADFPIRYFYQANQGKHVASNRGVREAQGEFFLFFDSDDRCVPQALARFKHHWDAIPASEREGFSTITALCVGRDGSHVGPDFPKPVMDVADPCLQMKYRRAGERWGINRTKILKAYPFPELPGEKFIAEGIIWMRISLSYKTRFINERLRIFDLRSDGLSASSVRLRMQNAGGARLCYQEFLHPELPLASRVRDAVNYCRFSFHSGTSLYRLITESRHPLLASTLVAPGFVAYYLDRMRYSSR